MSDYRAPEERLLTHRQIRKFPKEIRDLTVDLVNNYGIVYRLQADGQHVLLYSGKEGDRPFKVGAMRNPAATKRYLSQWIADNVPNYSTDKKKEQIVDAVFKCGRGCKDAAFASVEEINAHYESEHPKPDVAERVAEARKEFGSIPSPAEVARKAGFSPEPPATWVEPPTKPEPVPWVQEDPTWAPYVYPSSGKTSEFLHVTVDQEPPVLRCVADDCDYQRVGKFTGAHLHERSHTTEGQEQMAAARAAGAASRKIPHADISARGALETLAAFYGLTVITVDEMEDVTECEALRQENDRLKTELDEVKAKIALIREATGL